MADRRRGPAERGGASADAGELASAGPVHAGLHPDADRDRHTAHPLRYRKRRGRLHPQASGRAAGSGATARRNRAGDDRPRGDHALPYRPYRRPPRGRHSAISQRGLRRGRGGIPLLDGGGAPVGASGQQHLPVGRSGGQPPRPAARPHPLRRTRRHGRARHRRGGGVRAHTGAPCLPLRERGATDARVGRLRPSRDGVPEPP